MNILIKNGTVVDGTGSSACETDILISGNEINQIGKCDNNDFDKVIDAEGLIVSPGFIDGHRHSDYSLFLYPDAPSSIYSGITTEIIGNCGFSCAPLNSQEDLKMLGIGYKPDVDLPKWRYFTEYFDRLNEIGLGINVGALVGHNALRAYVMGFEERAPTFTELEDMKELLSKCMDEGTLGFSVGLEYPPSRSADTEEISQLVEIVAEHKGIFQPHIRNRADGIIKSVNEVIEIAEKTQCRLQIAHLFPKYGAHKVGGGMKALEKMKEAILRGVDVATDQLPYDMGWGSNIPALLPKWVFDDGVEDLKNKLKNKEIRKKIKQYDSEYLGRVIPEGLWQRVILMSCEVMPELEGKNFTELPQFLGVDEPKEAMLKVLLMTIENNLSPFDLIIGADAYEKTDIPKIILDPLTMITSDGLAIDVKGPLANFKWRYSYGPYPRLIEEYVLKKKILTLEEAIRKSTSMPAARYKIYDRGILKPKMKADIVIFDLKKIKDNTTDTNFNIHPSGVTYVMINGTLVIEKSKLTGERPGKIIKS